MPDWVHTRLGDLIDIKHGYAFKGEYFHEEPPGDFLLTPGNFAIGGGFQWGKRKYYRDGGPVPNEFVLRPGDLLVTMTDLSKEADTLGYSAVVPESGFRLLHNQRLGKVIKKSESIDFGYLHWLLRSPDYRNEILASYTGSTVKHTSPKKILAYQFLCPQLQEQRQIATVLDSLEHKIELNRRMNETLETMARAIFKDWFVDFGPTRAKVEGRAPYLAPELWDLFPDTLDDEDKPVGWDKKAMGELCEVTIGGLWGKDQSESADFEEYYCLRGVDLQHLRELGEAPNVPSRFAKRTAIEKRCISINDVLIASSGAGPCGRTLWVGTEGFFNGLKNSKQAIYSNFVKRLHCISPSVACFLDRHLNEMRVSGEIQKYISGTSVPNLNDKGLLQSHQIILPSEPLLDAFFGFTLTVQRRLFSWENATLAQTRDLLLPKLMSGEIRLSEAEKAVEAVA